MTCGVIVFFFNRYGGVSQKLSKFRDFVKKEYTRPVVLLESLCALLMGNFFFLFRVKTRWKQIGKTSIVRMYLMIT